MGKSTINGSCSIAMLNYQRVPHCRFPRENVWQTMRFLEIPIFSDKKTVSLFVYGSRFKIWDPQNVDLVWQNKSFALGPPNSTNDFQTYFFLDPLFVGWTSIHWFSEPLYCSLSSWFFPELLWLLPLSLSGVSFGYIVFLYFLVFLRVPCNIHPTTCWCLVGNERMGWLFIVIDHSPIPY